MCDALESEGRKQKGISRKKKKMKEIAHHPLSNVRLNKKPGRVKTKGAISREKQAEAQARFEMNRGVLACCCYMLLLTSAISAREIF